MTDDCPICSAKGDPIGTHVREGERWTCLCCRSCACQYWYPREIRPEFYADPEQATYERRRGGESFLRARHRLFIERAQPGRLLDIGCGEGAFLAAAQERGFEVSGIDLDPGSIEVARHRGLTRVRALPLFDPATGALEPELERGQPFDSVTAFEVLEHQAQPLDFLRATRQLLAPGGRLCGSVPNRDRLFVERQRRVNFGDFPPHHFLWFSAATLEHTLRTAGFTDVTILPVPEDELVRYASYLEDALLGGVTKAAKRSVHKIGSGKKASGRRKQIVSAIRSLKNLPFVPLAHVVRTVLPMRLRGIYFEARR